MKLHRNSVKMCTYRIFPEFPDMEAKPGIMLTVTVPKRKISDTDYILKLTEGAKNPPFMVIDDCWQEHHRLDEYNGGPMDKR